MKKKIGTIGVDAGICWIGDPCYILHRNKKDTPNIDLGKTWGEFCDRLNEKSNRQPTLAQFNYNLGHAGLGVCVSTGYGDGVYDVYADIVNDRKWGKRVKSVTVVFIKDEKKSRKLMDRIASKAKR